jgi:hypothetical protein
MKPASVLVIAVVMFILGALLGEYLLPKRVADVETAELNINYELLDVRRDAAVLMLLNEARIADARKLLVSHLRAFVSESPKYEPIKFSDQTQNRLKKAQEQAKNAISEYEK